MGYLYAGEEAGARVVRHGIGWNRVGTTSYPLFVLTHEAWPAGEGGVCVFRRLIVPVRYDNGMHVAITPYVDGVPLAEKRFSAAGTGQMDCDVRFAKRGSRIAARIYTVGSHTGEVEIIDCKVGYAVIRTVK